MSRAGTTKPAIHLPHSTDRGASFWVQLNTVMAVEVGVLLFGALALRRIVRRHGRLRRRLRQSADEPAESAQPTALEA